MVGLIVLALFGGGGYFAFGATASSAVAGRAQVSTTPTIAPVAADESIMAEAVVVPVRSVSLSFGGTSPIAQVFVQEGDTVQQGAPLAQLDTRDLLLAVDKAKANLSRAQAAYDKLVEGATPEQIAQAQAEVERAKALLKQTQGTFTDKDVAAAQANRESAQSALADLQNGPHTADAKAARARLDSARTHLRVVSQGPGAADLQAARSRLNQANVHLRQVESSGKAANKPTRIDPDARAAAQAEVAAAQADLDKLQRVDPDQLAAAQAKAASTQADLDRLQGAQREGSLAAAQAGVEIAQAALSQLTARPAKSALSQAVSDVEQAKVALKEAELALAQATLRAPIAGTVAQLNLKAGEVLTTTRPALIIADLSAWQIETTDLSELSIGDIKPGDVTKITFDALPDFEMTGKITQIKSIGTNKQGSITYTVVVTPDKQDQRLRWNMTASVSIASKRASAKPHRSTHTNHNAVDSGQ